MTVTESRVDDEIAEQPAKVRLTKNVSQVKSKVVIPKGQKSKNKADQNLQSQPIIFEEDGETINMEIDDGGAAAEEFASDVESQDKEQSSDSGSDTPSEDGEITSTAEQGNLCDSGDDSMSQSQDDGHSQVFNAC